MKQIKKNYTQKEGVYFEGSKRIIKNKRKRVGKTEEAERDSLVECSFRNIARM